MVVMFCLAHKQTLSCVGDSEGVDFLAGDVGGGGDSFLLPLPSLPQFLFWKFLWAILCQKTLLICWIIRDNWDKVPIPKVSIVDVTAVNPIILCCSPHLVVEENAYPSTLHNFDMTQSIISSAPKGLWALILKMYSSLFKCHSNSNCKYIEIYIVMTITATVIILTDLSSILITIT